jgi:hypothetical protein
MSRNRESSSRPPASGLRGNPGTSPPSQNLRRNRLPADLDVTSGGPASAPNSAEELGTWDLGTNSQALSTAYQRDAYTPISENTPLSYFSSSYMYPAGDLSPDTVPRTFLTSPTPETLPGLQDQAGEDHTLYIDDNNHFILQGVGGRGIWSTQYLTYSCQC